MQWNNIVEMKRLMNFVFGLTKNLLVFHLCCTFSFFWASLYGQSWQSVKWSDLQTGMEIIIVDTVSGLAMSNDNGTSSAPDGIPISFHGSKLTLDTSEIDSGIVWRVEKDSLGCIFHKADDTTRWLYCTNANNGVRVGSNMNRIFSLYEGNWLFNLATSRYVGVYSGGDWRAYTTQPTTGAVKTTRTAFYRFVPRCHYFADSLQSGCDSVIYVDSKQIEWIFFSDTTMRDTIRAMECDTILCVRFTVHHASPKSEIYVSAVDSFAWYEYVYRESGDHIKNWSNQYGCDSMEILHLEILHVHTDTSIVDTLEILDSLSNEHADGDTLWKDTVDQVMQDSVRVLPMSDTTLTLPYGVCSISSENLVLSMPVVTEAWLENLDTMWRDVPLELSSDSTYLVRWIMQFKDGWMDTCVQRLVIKQPLCGEENGMKLEAVDVDGNRYETVRLGCHCWMAENLRVRFYSAENCGLQGSAIPRVGSYFSSLYPDSIWNGQHYGYLYDWYAATGMREADDTFLPCVDSLGKMQGICPNGWHLPTEEEWLSLMSYLTPDLIASTGWLGVNGNGSTTFALRPAGFFDAIGQRYVNLLGETVVWAADDFVENASAACFQYSCPYWQLRRINKKDKCSVRCVKDET